MYVLRTRGLILARQAKSPAARAHPPSPQCARPINRIRYQAPSISLHSSFLPTTWHNHFTAPGFSVTAYPSLWHTTSSIGPLLTLPDPSPAARFSR